MGLLGRLKLALNSSSLYEQAKGVVSRYEYLQIHTKALEEKLKDFEVKDEIDREIKRDLENQLKEMRKEMTLLKLDIQKTKEILGRIEL